MHDDKLFGTRFRVLERLVDEEVIIVVEAMDHLRSEVLTSTVRAVWVKTLAVREGIVDDTTDGDILETERLKCTAVRDLAGRKGSVRRTDRMRRHAGGEPWDNVGGDDVSTSHHVGWESTERVLLIVHEPLVPFPYGEFLLFGDLPA